MIQPHLLQRRCRLLLADSRALTTNQQWHGHVFQRGEFRQQVMELIDEAQIAVAQLASVTITHAGQSIPGNGNATPGCPVQPAQQIQQGRLARAGGTNDRQDIALSHGQIHTTQHFQLVIAFLVALNQFFGLKHDTGAGSIAGIIHSAGPPPVAPGWHARKGKGWPKN